MLFQKVTQNDNSNDNNSNVNNSNGDNSNGDNSNGNNSNGDNSNGDNSNDNNDIVVDFPDIDIENQLFWNNPVETCEFTFNFDNNDRCEMIWNNTFELPQYNLNTPAVLSWDNNTTWSLSDNWYENWGDILEGYDNILTWIDIEDENEQNKEINEEHKNQKSEETNEEQETVDNENFDNSHDRDGDIDNYVESYSFNFDSESDNDIDNDDDDDDDDDGEELETCIINGIVKELNENDEVLSFTTESSQSIQLESVSSENEDDLVYSFPSVSAETSVSPSTNSISPRIIRGENIVIDFETESDPAKPLSQPMNNVSLSPIRRSKSEEWTSEKQTKKQRYRRTRTPRFGRYRKM